MRKPVIVGIDPLRPDPAPMVVGVALARLTGAPLVAAASYVQDTITDAMSGGLVEADLRDTARSVLDDLTTGGLDAERVVVPGYSAAHALHSADSLQFKEHGRRMQVAADFRDECFELIDALTDF